MDMNRPLTTSSASTVTAVEGALYPKIPLLELTSTRFFAAMAVLLGHFNEFLPLPVWLSRWIAGGFGVSFFFVLSGFILCYVYWDDFVSGVTARRYWKYFSARIARIYPSYALALILITSLYLMMNAVRPGTIGLPGNTVTSWLMNLFALQTFAPSYLTQQVWNAPSWSVSTEFGFYIFCPLILFSIARDGRSSRWLVTFLAATVTIAIVMQALALLLVLEYGWSQQFWLDLMASRNIFWRMPEFLTGVIAARLLYGGHLPWLNGAGARNTLLVISFAAVTILNVGPWPSDPTSILIMRQFRLDVAYMLPFAGIVLALAAGPSLASSFLKIPFLVFLGDISYGIYIYHWIPWTVLSHAKAHGLDLPVWSGMVVIVVTIMFSAASYVWYEMPARLYLRKKFGH